jgi:TolB-like protein/predicted metal-dependent HD superfamily phosphohydrolase/Tfp pilus assembly protein PilF
MPSIVSGFEYDIFISYRHKDNKYLPIGQVGDGWVSDFVANLKREIGATFKEDVSVYFDNNPYDGLLETHSVNKSLEAKLKSLIFIPIISQTYCDTKSFAWRQEFCVFNQLAKEDQFGRDIKLSNGNVASRILPVKIHDLDADDQAILEKELGGALRAVEFIFKSAGVNRPLYVNDKREENLNRLFYRDQINKVANAIKEIINGMRNPDKRDVTIKNPVAAETLEKSEATNKSIAVLPFTNLSQDVAQEYFADGITENILIQLASLKQLRVISRTSVMRYKKTTKTAPEIAAELNVKYLLEGSAQMAGNKVRIAVQLIDAATEDHLWSKVFVENMDDIFSVQSQVAEIVANELHASLAPKETEKLKQVPTKNLEAYDLFLKGRHAFNQWGVEGYKAATDYFKKAIALDPEFKEAYSYLASSYSARMSWNGDLSPMDANQNIEICLSEAWKRGATDNDYLTKAFVEFFIQKNFAAAEKLLTEAITLNANNANTLYTYSYLLCMMGRVDEAFAYVNKAKVIEPLSVAYFNYQTICLHLSGKNEEALEVVNEGLQLYPSVLRFYDFKARIYLTLEKWKEAEETLVAGFRTATIRPPSMVAYLAIAYHRLERNEKSLELVEELIKRSEQHERGVNYNLMYVFSDQGDLVTAQRWHTKAKKTNDVGLVWWQVDPLLKKLREAPVASADFIKAEKYITDLLEEKMPAFPYHNKVHVYDVVEAAQKIAEGEKITSEEIKLVRLAALFHDIGFMQSSRGHEAHGAALVRSVLPTFAFAEEQVEAIANMILATRLPQMPTTHIEKILCDADLDYLGRDDFYEIGGRLYLELKEQGVLETEREWNIMQRTFLQSHRYHTVFAQTNRESQKQQRLDEITAKLKSRA